MNKGLLFMLLGVFLFLILLYVPVKAEDIMSWSPRMFAGGAYAEHDQLLKTAIIIKHGSESQVPHYQYYYNYSYPYTDQTIEVYSTGYWNTVSANVTASGGK